MGVTVSRKVGKAVARNRVKRLCREAFRRNAEKLPRGLDFVMVARQGRPADVYAQVVAEMLDAMAVLRERNHPRAKAPGGSRRRRRR